MAVKIKLLRMGKIRAPHYRIVVADSRTKRDGRAIETIGRYSPTVEPSLIEVDSDRAQYWLSVGAQPTEPVAAILRVTGDWQRFRGEPGAEGTLRTAQAKPDKKAVFEAAARESAGETGESATTPRSRRSEGQRSGDTTSQESQASPAESQASPAESQASPAESQASPAESQASQASPAEPAPAPAEPAPAAEPETPAPAEAATQDAAAEGAARTEG